MKHVTSVYLIGLILLINLMSSQGRAQSFSLSMTPSETIGQTSTKTLSTNGNSRSQEIFINTRGLLKHLQTSGEKDIFIHSHSGYQKLSLHDVNMISPAAAIYRIDKFGITDTKIELKDFSNYRGSNVNGEYVMSSYKNADPYGYWKEKDVIVEFGPEITGDYNIRSGNAIQSNYDDTYHLEGACHARGALSPIVFRKERRVSKTIESKVIELTLVLDAEFVNSNGGETNAITKALGVLNSVHSNFDGEFLTDISFEVKDIVLSNCDGCDPWSDDRDIASLLLEVNDWAMTQTYLNRNDAVLFWTGRDFEGDAIGSAYNGSLCSELNTVVLQDLNEGPWALRVLAAHELGHTLNSDHDHSASATIMAPSLTNSNSWSSNSIAAINSFISTEDCLSESSTFNCSSVDSLEATLSEDNQLHLSWSCSETIICNVMIVDLSDQSVVYDSVSIYHHHDVSDVLLGCEEYRVIVTPFCDQGIPLSTQLIVSTWRESDIIISNAMPSNCYVENGITYYDLNLEVSNLGGNQSVDVEAGEANYNIVLFPGANNYQLKGLLAKGDMIDLRISATDNNTPACLSQYSYSSPGQDCALSYGADFDNCEIPDGWEVSSAGNTHDNFKWKPAGTDRSILNYGNSQNALSSKSIDGTCMMIIDDDLVNLQGYSGITWITSEVFDLSQYDVATISFDYVFDDFAAKGINDSYLRTEVWDGNSWHVAFDASADQCQWYNVWSEGCISNEKIDLSSYINSELKVRWVYSDGGTQQWTGMAALDNVSLSASRPISLPCGDEVYQIVDGSSMQDTLRADMFFVQTEVVQSTLILQATTAVVIEPGASVMQGVDFGVKITPCDN